LGLLKKNILQVILFIILSVGIISLNWDFFKPVHAGPLTDEQKFTGEAWRLQSQAGILDYLPIDAKDDPEKAPDGLANIITGKGTISNGTKGTNRANFDADLSADSVVRINLFQYPIWNITIDGNPVKVMCLRQKFTEECTLAFRLESQD
jgi:hypothetical protein